MAVVDCAVKQVEDIARYHRREGHEAPVLAEAVDAKSLGHDGREYAEQKAVTQARKPRYKAE